MPPSLRGAARCRLEDFFDEKVRGRNIDNATRRLILQRMSERCLFCSAMRFKKDEPAGFCCKAGQVNLPQAHRVAEDIPPELLELFENDAEFKEKIRKYNQAHAFTSIGARVDNHLANGRNGVYTFKICGQIHHRIGGFLPPENGPANFSQIYFYDQQQQVERRQHVFADLDVMTLATLGPLLEECNPFVRQYVYARQLAEEGNNFDNLEMVFTVDDVDRRTHNAPTANIIGAIVPHDDERNPRDIVISCRDRFDEQGRHQLQRISELSAMYDPLQYVLLHPRGELGWTTNLPLNTERERFITPLMYYCYKIQIRRGEDGNRIPNHLHRGGRLFQQYVVDQYAKVEQNNLNFIRFNQNQLLQNLHAAEDALDNRDDDNHAGNDVYLPSSFARSRRAYKQRYHDSMALVRKFGTPSLFVTFTCNPGWEEITRELLPGQRAPDRPDIVVRVFNAKLNAFKHDIAKNNILGQHLADVHTIEFQKRGLPHAHMLIWLEGPDKPTTTEHFDLLASAEIPDPQTQPRLYEAVRRHMIHGPCGAAFPNSPCMVGGMCVKHFPKDFQAETELTNGFPLYRRRDNGRTVHVRNAHLNNQYVVPYNPYLLLKYDAHINFEVCSTVHAVKYIHKYIYKGPDGARVRFQNPMFQNPILQDPNIPRPVQVLHVNANGEREPVDEIREYVSGRFICPQSACWGLFSFKWLHASHTVIRLPVHMPRPNQEDSMLDGFFNLCEQDPRARDYLYHDIPLDYCWIAGARRWQRRVRNASVVPRMYIVSPAAGERYYLRLLLASVRGPTSFEDLRTVDGHEYATFMEACDARGLINNAREWRQALEDASIWASGEQMRRLFAQILTFQNPPNAAELFEEFFEDFTQGIDGPVHGQLPSPDLLRARVVIQITIALKSMNKDWNDFGLPRIDTQEAIAEMANQNLGEGNLLIAEQLKFRPDLETLTENEAALNPGQREVYDTILNCVRTIDEGPPGVHQGGTAFFLDAPGGYGKTFLYECIAGRLRHENKIVLSVASSGIAAYLLTGGRTAHSRFKIPIDLDEGATCNIPRGSETIGLLRKTSLIVWDEAPMMHRWAFEAVDRSLRSVMGVDLPFGGKVLLAGGDFRQILPVVPSGTSDQIIDATLSSSSLWRHFTRLRLMQNMRVLPHELNFADFLGRVGVGLEGEDGRIQVPEELHSVTELQELIDAVFPDFVDRHEEDGYLMDRVILAATNAIVDEINDTILEMLPGEAVALDSTDECVDEDEAVNFPVEFLHSLTVSGLPSHVIRLKPGMPIMLLRNLDPAKGLCNGTRLIVRRATNHVIEAEIAQGANSGDRVLIPKLDMSSNDPSMPVKFTRRQFPVKPCFAMTINKSQGQTLNCIGLDLRKPVFTHGQLYVALSRARSFDSIHVLLKAVEEGHPPDPLLNIVYPEVLLQ